MLDRFRFTKAGLAVSRSGRVFATSLALILAGCTVGPGGLPASPDQAPASPAPQDTSPPIVDNGHPVTYPPDNMWALLASTPGLQRASDTLAEAVAFADAVVVGRYVGVERGGRYGSDNMAIALIAVDSVAAGEPRVAPDGLLRVEFVLNVGPVYPELTFLDLERSLPKDPALLFLHSWASYIDLIGGVAAPWSALDRPDVYRTIGGDGAMRIVDGRIDPPAYIDGWPLALRDRAITDVVAEVLTVDIGQSP